MGKANFYYPLPKEVKEKVSRFKHSSFGLLFSRFIGYEKNWELKKEKVWGELENKIGKIYKDSKLNELMEALKNRQENILDQQRDIFKIESFFAKVVWRLTIGLGSSTVMETGMAFHRIYGIPYIPSTAQKGGLKSYYKEKGFNENDKKMILIFGDQRNKGKVTFFDAFPESLTINGKPIIELDIMNPHYQPYYDKKGKVPPADYFSPVPIKFLTIRKGTVFRFFLSLEKKYDDQINLSEVKEDLIKTLEEFGIGAKTRVGYGEMEKCQ